MNKEKEESTCSNCYYSISKASAITQTQGMPAKRDWFCRRNPPYATGFPSVSPNDWCGCWHEELEE